MNLILWLDSILSRIDPIVLGFIGTLMIVIALWAIAMYFVNKMKD
jgi:hypothetical protein